MKRDSILWVGTFNYAHEVEIVHRYAPTWAAAKVRMLRGLAEKHDVAYEHVFKMFDGTKDNFHIEREERV